MITAVCLVGAMLILAAHRRAEGVRAAYRIKTLADRLAQVRNENAWLRAELERRRNPMVLAKTAKALAVELPVEELPVVRVRRRPVQEIPGQ